MASSQTFVLCDDSDLTLTIETNGTGNRKETHFKVSSEVLKSKSEYFQASRRFNEKYGHKGLRLENEHILAMLVWLKHMHSEKDHEDDRGWELKGKYSNVDITTMWHIVRIGDKYLFDGEILRDFFLKWFKKKVDMEELEEEEARALALPCFVFDHVEGFAEITKWLAYNYAGHIKEKCPVHFKWEHQHLAPPDFVGPMNHVRGRLKSLIHRELWQEIGALLKARYCACGRWETTAGRYFSELVRTGAYPLEETYAKHSTNGILSRLRSFKMIPTSPSCPACNTNWKGVVNRAIQFTEGYFNGLCIDCMDRSMAKRESIDKDYWKHNEAVDGRWDKHCRIKHGEPTWYASWRGRDETRQKLIKEHRKEKRERDL